MRGSPVQGMPGFKGFFSIVATTKLQRCVRIIIPLTMQIQLTLQKVQKVRLEQFRNDVKTICVIALEMFLVSKLKAKQFRKNIHFVRIISFCKRIQNVVRKTFYSSRNISVLAI